MNGKQAWVGIAPSPKVFAELDQEEVTVLAHLAWSSAARRPVTASDIAALPDRNGKPLGSIEARHIVRNLYEMKIVSVLGMNNDRPLSIFLGGFQASARRPAPAARRPDVGRRPAPGSPAFSAPATADPGYPKAKPNVIIENKTRGLQALKTTALTPAFVPAEAGRLKLAQAEVESGKFGDDLVGAAVERKRILTDRIKLYERWLNVESHPLLPKFLERKRKALTEMEYQLERASRPGGSNRQQKRKAEKSE